MSVTASIRRPDGPASITPLNANASEHLERLKAQAAHPRCSCADGGDLSFHADRCRRCYGYREPSTGIQGEER